MTDIFSIRTGKSELFLKRENFELYRDKSTFFVIFRNYIFKELDFEIPVESKEFYTKYDAERDEARDEYKPISIAKAEYLMKKYDPDRWESFLSDLTSKDGQEMNVSFVLPKYLKDRAEVMARKEGNS